MNATRTTVARLHLQEEEEGRLKAQAVEVKLRQGRAHLQGHEVMG